MTACTNGVCLIYYGLLRYKTVLQKSILNDYLNIMYIEIALVKLEGIRKRLLLPILIPSLFFINNRIIIDLNYYLKLSSQQQTTKTNKHMYTEDIS